MAKALVFIIIIILLFAFPAKGQSMQDVQDKILYYVRSIERLDTSSNLDRRDSLRVFNKNLLNYLTETCLKNPATLKYDFATLKNSGFNILTSEDKKFRIYCWDVMRGGSAHSFNALIQYDVQTGTKIKILNDDSNTEEGVVSSGSYYSDLYTFHTASNKTVYLAIGHGIIWSGAGGDDISAYTIENGELNDSIKFFQTPTRSFNSIEFSYDLTDYVNSDKNVGYPEFKLSSDKQTLYVPIIKKNDEITSKFLVYKFNGYKFVYDKNAK